MKNIVSMMIRWGDKCKQSYISKRSYNILKRAESICSTYDHYMMVFDELKLLQPNIDSIIATSDTEEIILNMTREYGQNKDLNLIINSYDVMPETGGYNHYWLKDKDNIYNVIVSILSTMKLQFGAKYYILASASNWSDGISDLALLLNCVPNINKHDEDNQNIERIIIPMAVGFGIYAVPWFDPEIPGVIWPRSLSEIKRNEFQNQNWNEAYGVKNVWT